MQLFSHLFSTNYLGSYACPARGPAPAGYPSLAPIRLCSRCCCKPGNTGDTTQTLTLYGVQMSGGSHTYRVEVTDTNGCSAKAYRTIVYSGVGIHEQNADKWKVYPNPAGESLTIELPQAMQAEAVLKLYNQSGAVVRNTEWPAQQQKYQLSLSGLSNGIYWLELDDGTQTLRKKVVTR